MTVMLHGMCNAPEWECPYFADAVQKTSWLICPRASIRCDGGGAIWSWKKKAETVEAAVERVKARYPSSVDEASGRTLMGFSLGAIAGMDLAHFGAGKWSSVILIGAKVRPNADLLRRSGVQRLLMVAGEYDMMRGDMFRQTRRLSRQGFPSAFLSLGKIGHAFPADMNDRVAQALAWAHGDDTALEPTGGG
jgi:predicted esterase